MADMSILDQSHPGPLVLMIETSEFASAGSTVAGTCSACRDGAFPPLGAPPSTSTAFRRDSFLGADNVRRI